MACSSSSKRKHKFLTIETKIEILNRLSNGESGSSLAKFYDVGKSTITDIKNNKQKIITFASKLDSYDGAKKRKTMRTANDSTLDDAIYLWFAQRRILGEPISGALLCEKALDFNKQLGGPSDFKASTGWVTTFKSRHGIRELRIEGDILYDDFASVESDFAAVELFIKQFIYRLESEGYSKDDVYNVDETGINWKSLPKKSPASRCEAAAPELKMNQERLIAMVCANANGTHTLPLTLIGKSKKPRCFKNVSCLPVNYKAQKNAWMNPEVFTDWFTNDFIPNVKMFREREGKIGKVLLILDNAPSHPSAETLNAIDDGFEVMFFPSNVTTLLQPMDQGVIEKLKRMYKKQVLHCLLLAESCGENIVAFTKQLSLKDSCYMLADAWESLTVQNLKNAWKKLWPNAEETDGDEPNDTEENEGQILNEMTNLIQSVPGFENCDESDARAWLENDTDDTWSPILNDNEILNVVKETGAPDHDTDEDDNEEDIKTGPTHAEAFAALETAMAWYEQQTECCPTQLLLLKRVKDLAAKKQSPKIVQQKNT